MSMVPTFPTAAAAGLAEWSIAVEAILVEFTDVFGEGQGDFDSTIRLLNRERPGCFSLTTGRSRE